MNPAWSELIEGVCWTAKRMAELSLVVGSGGNVSARLPGEELIAITPGSMPYGRMQPDDIVVVNLDGMRVEGRQRVLERQPGSRAVLLANHGMLAVGTNLEQALSVAENVERAAQIYYLARTLGTPHLISAGDYERVRNHYAALRKAG